MSKIDHRAHKNLRFSIYDFRFVDTDLHRFTPQIFRPQRHEATKKNSELVNW